MKRALLLGLVLAIAAPTGAARAGSYVVHSCGANGVNNAWHATPPPPGVMEVNEACHADPQMDGIWVRDVLASSSDLTDGQGAWLQFDAPAGTAITGITYKRWLWKDAIDDLHPELRTADDTVLETCSIPYNSTRCDVGGEGTDAVTYNGLSTTRLQAGVRCQITEPFATDCPGGGTQHGYGAVITDAAVTIEDDTPPGAPTVADSGLWSGADWYDGTSSVTLSGGDASGIAAARIYADGQLLTTATPTCDYTRPKPCADASDLQVPIDTTRLADGQHPIAVTLVDPAGNESAPVSHSVRISNDAPAAPQLTLTPTRSTSPSFTASWTSTHPVPIARAHVTICSSLGCTVTTTTQSSIALLAPTLGTTTVSVYLEDALGHANAANAAMASFLLDATAPAGATTTTPPAVASPAAPLGGRHPVRVRPALRVSAAARRRSARITARIDHGATGSMTFTIRITGRAHGGKRWSWVARRRVRVRSGSATVRVLLPHGAKRVAVTVAFGGSARLLAASAKRVLFLR